MIRKSLMIVWVLLAVQPLWAQQSDTQQTLKRIPLSHAPDSLTPGAYHYAGFHFGRMMSGIFAFQLEYLPGRAGGISLEFGYKPPVMHPQLPNRYQMITRNVSRIASHLWTGTLAYRQYARAGKRSFIYIGPYFRFDYLEARNVLIHDCYDNDYPAYLFNRSTRIYKTGVQFGFRFDQHRLPFTLGLNLGVGQCNDANDIVQLKHLEYEDPVLTYRFYDGYIMPDVSFDLVFSFHFKKTKMFGR